LRVGSRDVGGESKRVSVKLMKVAARAAHAGSNPALQGMPINVTGVPGTAYGYYRALIRLIGEGGFGDLHETRDCMKP
jgi:hypothetical protein